MIKNNQLQLIKKLSWPEVFEIWRKNEDYSGSHWIEHWQSRGFSSWQEWRERYVKPWGLDHLDWELYEIINPVETVAEFCGGSFRSWAEKFYNGKDNPSFIELAANPEIQNHQGVLKFFNNFPKETIISAVILNGKIVIVEGMHRCAALGLAAHYGKKIDTKVQLALAQYDMQSLPVIGQQVKQ